MLPVTANAGLFTPAQHAEEERPEDRLGTEGKEGESEQAELRIRVGVELGDSGEYETGDDGDRTCDKSLLESDTPPESLQFRLPFAEEENRKVFAKSPSWAT